MLVERGGDRAAGREQHLTQHDDRHEAVPLDHVPGMPRRGPAAFGDHRHEQLADDENAEGDGAAPAARQEAGDPQQLQHRDPHGIREARRAPLGVASGRAQPEGHHGDAHDRVPEHRDVIVTVVERPWHPRREHEHPGHLHEGQRPEKHVVGVVCRGEPGEVHPRPPDRPEHHEVAAQVAPVRLSEPVVQVRRRRGDGDNEGEVEEQLQRGRRPVFFVAVPAAEPHRPRGFVAGGHGARVCRAVRFGGTSPTPRFPRFACGSY